jgi:tRNA threonylcarbamoyladenosine biosynthesis protein TsaE
MSTVMIYRTNTTSSGQTERLGERLGQTLRGGEVFELISDLGGGKTTFVRGLAHGLGSTDHVASPTFTISREYKTTQRTLYHYDFYRLSDAGIMSPELTEAMADPAGIVVVEWASIVENVLPDRRVTLTIEVIAEEARRLTFTYQRSLAYLFEPLVKEARG